MNKQYLKKLLVLPLAIGLLAGCSPSSPIPIPSEVPSVIPVEDQFEYVRNAADHYLSSNLEQSITPEKLYKEFVLERQPKYLLVDIRANEDFIAKNIRGSINIPYAQTASLKKIMNLPKAKTLVVIDYNGHWAAQTAATWNMLGFHAVPLLYGMQSWTTDELSLGYDLFPSAPQNYPLVKEPISLGQYELPELKLPQAKAEEIIRILSGTYLNRNYKGFIQAEEIAAKINEGTVAKDMYLVDIRSAEHYTQGHIPGSVNLPYGQLAKPEMLKRLPLDNRIVLVGYNGMEASQGARILVTLGYDAVALKYGMSYWNSNQEITGVSPIQSLVQDHYELTPLNYTKPSTGAAGCG